MGTVPEADECVGEGGVGVHRDVSGDVVKDVGFRQIVEAIGVADCYRRRELTVSQAVEEQERRNIAADRFRAKACEWAEELVDGFEARHAIRVHTQAFNALQKMRIGVPLPGLRHPRIEPSPGFMVRFGVEFVGLLDIECAFPPRLFDERRVPRRQPHQIFL